MKDATRKAFAEAIVSVLAVPWDEGASIRTAFEIVEVIEPLVDELVEATG